MVHNLYQSLSEAPRPSRHGRSIRLDWRTREAFVQFNQWGPSLVQELQACLLELSVGSSTDVSRARRALRTLRGLFGALGLFQASAACRAAGHRLDALKEPGFAPPRSLVEWLRELAHGLETQVAWAARDLESGQGIVSVVDLNQLRPDAPVSNALEGLVVAVGSQRFVLPAAQVSQVKPAEGVERHEAGVGAIWMEAPSRAFPLLSLEACFPGAVPRSGSQVLHLTAMGAPACLLVDAVLGRQWMVQEGPADVARAVSATAILKDGQTLPVVDPDALLGQRQRSGGLLG